MGRLGQVSATAADAAATNMAPAIAPRKIRSDVIWLSLEVSTEASDRLRCLAAADGQHHR
jgi:DNA-binding transcriptional regulator YdaS (Cro superfamily)